jgi:H/ACA ribonucleoprotein complex subunit 4
MRLHTDIEEKKLREVIEKFLGKIKQLPPVRSRVKRAFREREVKIFKILEREGKDILFETQVQAGTYIRKLCDDIGKEIGGAHMLELRRTNAGIFSEGDLVTLYELEEAVAAYKLGNEQPLRSLLSPGEIIGLLLPVVLVKHAAVQKLYRGSPLFASFLVENVAHEKDKKVAVFDEQRFIGCYRIVNEGSVFGVPEFVLN